MWASAALRRFETTPEHSEVPVRIPSPFADGEPHPLARRAAEALKGRLQRGEEPLARLLLGDGKMLGVLVVETPQGQLGWLEAFSGSVGGRWLVDGFAPPLFDVERRERREAEVRVEAERRAAQRRVLLEGEEARALAIEERSHAAGAQAAQAALRGQQEQRQMERRSARARLAAGAGLDGGDPAAIARRLADLAAQSRSDQRARRAFEEAARAARAPLDARRARLDAALEGLVEADRAASQALLSELWADYELVSFLGERRTLTSLFAPLAPPGGAGDCAAPKLLQAARRAGLRPVALAEFWWGAPSPSGSRLPGRFYPSCRTSCALLLPFVLDGLRVEPPPLYGSARVPEHEPAVIYEDEALLVVDKPAGLLTVPGRNAALADCVATRLQRRFPAADPRVVHRLDLDTSGLVLVGKGAEAHAALSRQFARGAVEKRYVAVLDGELSTTCGRVDLPLRLDVDDRPRQIVDYARGRPAQTEWELLSQSSGRARVALFPSTGRTHQLRVHAAHPAGLGCPIVGDRLYGREAERLLLHAERLRFCHPRTGAWLTVESPAPF
jgi:tRNA pseudouridine32 synthase/23S rRNA pseudouridine746 synthase